MSKPNEWSQYKYICWEIEEGKKKMEDRESNLRFAAAEVLAAYREHQAFLLVGGHQPDRVNDAIQGLEYSLERMRQAQVDDTPPNTPVRKARL